jgi:Ca-activated chloride channel family protein
MGNYHDSTMQALVNHGNGVASYIGTLEEAHKVMVTEAQSTLFPIAKDVKLQVKLNPAVVAEYRLIGYEMRILKREDSNYDKMDAGDINSAAIFEISFVGSEGTVLDEYELRCGDESMDQEGEDSSHTDECAFITKVGIAMALYFFLFT